MPPEVEAAINELISITGRSKEDCVKALKAAQNIPDIACELLLSGQPIPEAALGGGGDGQAEDDEMYGDEGDVGEGGGGGGLGQYNLDPETL